MHQRCTRGPGPFIAKISSVHSGEHNKMLQTIQDMDASWWISPFETWLLSFFYHFAIVHCTAIQLLFPMALVVPWQIFRFRWVLLRIIQHHPFFVINIYQPSIFTWFSVMNMCKPSSFWDTPMDISPSQRDPWRYFVGFLSDLGSKRAQDSRGAWFLRTVDAVENHRVLPWGDQ